MSSLWATGNDTRIPDSFHIELINGGGKLQEFAQMRIVHFCFHKLELPTGWASAQPHNRPRLVFFIFGNGDGGETIEDSEHRARIFVSGF
jgi:hypothetical protein